MPTGDKYLHIVSKRVLGTDDFGTRFLEYMRSRVEEVNKEQYGTAFFHPNGVLANSAAADQFTLAQDTGGGSAIASDGLGNFLDFENSTYQNIQFENTLGVNYHVALKYCNLPSGIQINPRTGKPEWISYEDQIGEKGNPNTVIDNGNNTITFRVDSVTEAGVDNTGRVVTVYKILPGDSATTEAIAKEDCTVFYSSSQNQITTTGSLGQTNVSLVAADYEVVMKGPTVKRYTDLSAAANYCYIGYLTGTGAGNPPTSFNRDNQKIVPHSWTELLIDGLDQDFFPTTDNTHNLGTATKRWANIYTVNLVVSSDFLPVADNTQDIGSLTYRWNDGFFGGLIECLDLDVTGSGLGEGVQTDLVPSVDDNSWLGTTSHRYAGVYTNLVHVEKLEVESGSVDQGVATDLYPTANNTYDLGGGAYYWDGLASRDVIAAETFYVSYAVGEGVRSEFVPRTTNTYNLGNSSYQWEELYVGGDGAYINNGYFTRDITVGRRFSLTYAQPTPQPGCASDFNPNADDTYDLGSASYQWAQVRAGDLSLISTAGRGVLSHIVPTSDETHNLGAATLYEWANIYTAKITLNTGAGNGVASNAVPTADDSYDLGSTSYRWQDLYLDGTADVHTMNVSSGSSGLGFISDCSPGADDTHSLGENSYRWQDLWVDGTGYIDKLILNTSVGDGVGGHMYPSANNTHNIGSSTYYYANVYSNNVYYKTTLTTFDDFNDLELIERYNPTEKVVAVEKKGVKRIIRKADPDTLPWPMLGDKDPDKGDYFLHAGDSITFLLGAIKQLYQEHKAALERLAALELKTAK